MPFVENSILDTTKKALGVDSEYTRFDPEIIMHINSVFTTLQQLGVGPAAGYMIEGQNNLWSEFISNPYTMNSVKTLMAFKVRLAWDPPGVASVLASMERQVQELEWRLNVANDTTWTHPFQSTDPDED